MSLGHEAASTVIQALVAIENGDLNQPTGHQDDNSRLRPIYALPRLFRVAAHASNVA